MNRAPGSSGSRQSSYAGVAASSRSTRGSPHKVSPVVNAMRVFNRPIREQPPPPPSVATAFGFQSMPAPRQHHLQLAPHSNHKFMLRQCVCGKVIVQICSNCNSTFCKTDCKPNQFPCRDPPPYPGTSKVGRPPTGFGAVQNFGHITCGPRLIPQTIGPGNPATVMNTECKEGVGMHLVSLNSGACVQLFQDKDAEGDDGSSHSDESDSSGTSGVTVIAASGYAPANASTGGAAAAQLDTHVDNEPKWPQLRASATRLDGSSQARGSGAARGHGHGARGHGHGARGHGHGARGRRGFSSFEL